MAINKVVYDGQTLIDLTSDTATASDVASGKTFHLADGTQATGTASGGSSSDSGEKAFVERSATNITLETATEIGAYGAYNFAALTEIHGPNVTKIGKFAFAGNGNSDSTSTNMANYDNSSALVTADFPNIEEIGEYAFYYCKKLSSFNGLSGNQNLNIKRSAFSYCDLSSINRIDAAIIDGGAFYHSNFNSGTLRLGDNIEFCKNYKYNRIFYDANFTKVIIGGGSDFKVNSSSYRPFYSCAKLTQVNILGPITFSDSYSSLFDSCYYIKDIYVSWSEGEVAGAPWGASSSCTIHYDTVFDENGEVVE